MNSRPAVIALASLLVLGSCALAQDTPSVKDIQHGFAFGIRPQLIDLSGAPGARRTFDLYLRNYDVNRPGRAWLWVQDALQQPNGAVTFADVGAYEYSCARWIRLDRDQVLVPPGKEEKVRVTLTVPGGVRGSFHGIIAVSGTPPPKVDIAPSRDNQVYSVTRVAFGVIVHYSIPGTLKPDAQIETVFTSNEPPPRSGLSRETAPYKRWLVARIRNRGNSMLYGWGWATLRRQGGGLVNRWRIGGKEEGHKRVIYPGRSVDVYLPLTRQLPAGEYVAKVRYDYAQYKAAVGELPLTVTEDDVRAGLEAQTGPFRSLNVGLSITVGSEFDEISVAPGGFRTGVVQVTNNEDTALLVTASATDLAMDPDGVLTPTGSPQAGAPPVGEWLQIGPTEFQLAPGKSRKLVYKVGPPKREDMATDLLGLIQFSARKLDVIAREAEEEVIGETGTLVIATMAGKGRRAAELGVLQVDVRPEMDKVVQFGIPVKCTGDVHFFPVVRFSLLSSLEGASPLEAIIGLKDRFLVLPGMERVVWVQVGREKLRPGRYLATVSLDYGGTEPATRGYTVDLQDLSMATPPTGGESDEDKDAAPTETESGQKPDSDTAGAPQGGGD